jgi:anaerobic ribonucleoside-triphosphate reductase activating protein
MKNNQIRLAGPIESDSIVNGDGLRTVVWCQGCRFQCPGCHNPESWNEKGGILMKINEIKKNLEKFRGQTGLTFCGGEPMLQPKECKKIGDWVKKTLGWSVWSFTGYTYEEIKAEGGDKWEFLKSLDVLIDGRFVLAERDLNLNFRGSRNQRLLRLKDGEIVGIE